MIELKTGQLRPSIDESVFTTNCVGLPYSPRKNGWVESAIRKSLGAQNVGPWVFLAPTAWVDAVRALYCSCYARQMLKYLF